MEGDLSPDPADGHQAGRNDFIDVRESELSGHREASRLSRLLTQSREDRMTAVDQPVDAGAPGKTVDGESYGVAIRERVLLHEVAVFERRQQAPGRRPIEAARIGHLGDGGAVLGTGRDGLHESD